MGSLTIAMLFFTLGTIHKVYMFKFGDFQTPFPPLYAFEK